MVSIVMATFNRAGTIQRAVSSVLGQTYADWELVIVDDGSIDTTQKVLEQLTDPRVRVVTHSENRGVCAAKNTGFDHMRGEWFTTLDSDDEMMPDALETMLECAERTGANAITCECLDYSTGQFRGTAAPTVDGRLSPKATAKLQGDHWGLTRTGLLGDLRFDERLPSLGGLVWPEVNRKARRYYLHRALVIVHAEGADRVSQLWGASSLRDKADWFGVLAEHTSYLRELRRVNPRQYLHLLGRIWAARFLRPVLALTARFTKCFKHDVGNVDAHRYPPYRANDIDDAGSEALDHTPLRAE